LTKIAYASLLLFIFSIPWEQLILIPGVGTGSRLAGLAAFPLCLMAIIKSGRHYFHWPIALLGLFIVLAAFSILWTRPQSPPSSVGYDVDNGLNVLQTSVQLLLMAWLAAQMIDGETKLHGAFLAYILGSCVAALKAVEAYQTESYEAYLRYVAAGMDANDVALGLSVAIAMAGYLTVRRRGWWWLVTLGFIPLGIYGVLLSASRAGFLAMLIAASMPILLMLRPRHYARTIALSLAGLVAGSVLLVRYVPESSWNRIVTIRSEISEGDLNGRLVIWGAELDLINEAPVLGVGIGGNAEAMRRMVGWSQAPHNGLLTIATELGLVGLLIVVAAWVLVVRDVLSMRALERRGWCVILAVLLVAVMSLNWQLHKATWLLFAMALAHARYARPRPCLGEAVAPILRRSTPADPSACSTAVDRRHQEHGRSGGGRDRPPANQRQDSPRCLGQRSAQIRIVIDRPRGGR
jgi:O-antigen ligase